MTYFWIIITLLLIFEFIQLKNIYEQIKTISNFSEYVLEQIKEQNLNKYFKYLSIAKMFKDKTIRNIILFIIVFANIIAIAILYNIVKFILTI